MSIAHVTATFPPYYTGTGNVCYHNARVLAARGHDVHVYTAAWPGNVDDPSGVVIHRLKELVRFGNAPLLPQLSMLGRHDVIHLHYPFIFGAEQVALRSIFGRTPLTITYHNDLIAPGLRGTLFSLYERMLTRSILRAAKRVCVVSLEHAAASSAIIHAVRGQLERLVPIPNGVDTNVFHPSVDGAEVRRRLLIPASATVVGFIGALDNAHYFKRVDLLLKALAANQNAGLHALIVGDGDLLPSFERLALELAIQDRVHFAGGVPHSRLPPYVTAMDMLVLPSDSVESFGLVLIEAMACGRPVIASNLPGVGSLISPGRDGFLVPPGNVEALADAIHAMAVLPVERRRDMGATGRAKVEARYSWERIGDRIEQLYADMLRDRIPVHAG